jgi:cobalamin biosynthesis Mg chelatase CobN
MEQPPYMEDFDDLEEENDFEYEDEAAANRRQFMILVGALGAVLVVALLVFLFVMLSRNGAKSDIELTNEVVLATNEAIETAIVAAETAEVVEQTARAVAMVETQQAEEKAMAASATADAANATATAKAQPTATNTSTPTPVVASPIATATGEEGAEGTEVAQAGGTPTRTPWTTRTTTETPDTGIGGFHVVLIAAVLVVVVFAARRLRTAA